DKLTRMPDSLVNEVLYPLGKPSRFKLLPTQDAYYAEFKERVDEKKLLEKYEGKHIYQINFSNKGGLISPVLLEFEFKSGAKKTVQLPAEVWRFREEIARKVFVFDEPVMAVRLDPQRLT